VETYPRLLGYTVGAHSLCGPLKIYHNCTNKQGVCDTLALPFTLNSISRQKKNYGNSKYFTMQKYNNLQN
jgi:hypothetical protein